MTRTRCAALVLGVLALVAAPTARAGTLTSLSFSLAVQGLAPATFTASGLSAGTASGTGVAAVWNVAAGALPDLNYPSATFGTTTLPSTAAPPITQIYLQMHGNPSAGAFAAGAGGSMRVDLAFRLQGFGGLSILPIPLPVGEATTATDFVFGIAITAMANGWTTGTTTIALATPTTGGATAVTAQGMNLLSGGAGTVVLVTALNLASNISGQAPTFATLTLNYAPEPGGLALAAAGLAGVALLRWSRRPAKEADDS